MLRNILGVLAGYIAMALAVFVLLTGAYLAFGTERAFEPGTYRTSLAWCLTSLVLGIPPALLGGWVCARIGASHKAVVALAVLVALAGLAIAIPTLKSEPGVLMRSGDVSNLEAMGRAQTPSWVAFLNPVIGVFGVLVGGRKRSHAKPTSPPSAAVGS